MLRYLFRRFAKPTQPAIQPPPVPASTAPAPAPRRPLATPSTPVYPAADYGIAYVSVDEVLATQAHLLKRLKLLAALPEDEFDRFYLQVIRNLALHINQLPASEEGTHNGAGGLFRLALEIGFFALQASEARLFATRAGLEDRRTLEPRWRYATFLAGICCELHRPITNMVVVAPNGAEWPAFQTSLGEWLGKDEDRFFVRWVTAGKGTGQGASSYLLYKIIPEDALQFLHEASTHIVPTMLDVITGVSNPIERSQMQIVIDEVRTKVFERDAALRPTQYGKLTVGTHMEPHLMDAMRRLTSTGVWQINGQKSRLWYGEDGLFLVWKTAAKEMQQLLRDDGISGVPQDSNTLLDLLLKINVFQLDSDGSPFWNIVTPRSSNELLAVRFVSPLTILAALPDEPEKVGRLVPVAHETGQSTSASDPAQEATVNAVLPEAPAVQSAESVESSMDNRAAVPQAKTIEAVPEKPSGVALPSEMAEKLSPLTKDVLSALLEDHRGNKTKGATGKTAEGFGIGVDQLVCYGADVTAIIAELAKHGWLWMQPEKPNKKIHQVEINSKALQAVVLRTAVARDIGFIK